MARPQNLLILGGLLWGCLAAGAKPAFTASEIEGTGTAVLFCDLDGDHLKDAVLIGSSNVCVYFQDPKQGFSRQPQLQFKLDDRPATVWPARLGQTAESLLVMTSEGVTQLDFTNRTSPPVSHQIIQQPTIIPESGEPNVLSLSLSAKTGTAWPLLLVPVAAGLQVWQYRGQWQQAQFIEHALNTRHAPSISPGYDVRYNFSVCLTDTRGSGRDDLMIKRDAAGAEIYTLYLQGTNGLFNLEPALSYTNVDDWHTTVNWNDINHDGRLDLIKSTFSDEPSFVPGLQSSKVLVAEYLADGHGQIPARPQQVFRKSDWSGFLPMTDLDGDGLMDLVLGYLPIDARDGLRNMITAGQVNLTLRFHFFRPGTGFPKEPDCQCQLPVYFDKDLVWSTQNRIYYERFVSLNGDFNGDGKKDILVRDRSDAISVYCFNSRESGFSRKPDVQFACPETMGGWAIQDLNGDGISDLVVKLRGEDIYRVFTSQGK